MFTKVQQNVHQVQELFLQLFLPLFLSKLKLSVGGFHRQGFLEARNSKDFQLSKENQADDKTVRYKTSETKEYGKGIPRS